MPNPSFEIFDTCPTTLSIPGDYQINHALGWYAPTLGTSDYFNSCSSVGGGANVPNTAIGFQTPFDGQGYLGILLQIELTDIDWFEYTQAKLTSPLIQGYSYKFSFNVNLANNSDYAIKKIGAWFTPNAVSSNTSQSMFTTLPQIVNANGFIADTTGWTKIEGEFIANGGEEYLTIGYYSDTINVDTLRNSVFADPTSIFSYYYIDGLELEEVEQAVIIPSIITPNNDGSNDVFQLNFPYVNVIIYNRWGQQLFASNNNESYWNGRTTSGSEVPDGTYYYLITTVAETFKGFVQVIR